MAFLLWQCAAAPTPAPREYDINARSTFLRVDTIDPSEDPVKIDLDAIGVDYGDVLKLNTKGSYYNTTQLTERNSAVCVFSATDFLLDKAVLNRVADAIDAGVDYVTENTFAGDQPTDIPEDFKVDEQVIEVTVPVGAHYLFVGNTDSKQEDNSATPDGFGLELDTK